MSKDTWSLDAGRIRGLYRDRENGWLFGVCAGIAEFGNFNVGTVRIIAVVCLLLFTWATALIYIAATLLIRERPLIYSGKYDEYEFWRRRGRGSYWSHS